MTSAVRRYHPEEITLLARLSTRLGQGPGLLHEVQCEPLAALHVGDGLHPLRGCRCGYSGGCGPERDWALVVPAGRFGKRVEIVDAALVRFRLADRKRHGLGIWYPVGSIAYDGNVCVLEGNFSFGALGPTYGYGSHGGTLDDARRYLEGRRQPDNGYRVYEWQERTGNVLLAGYPSNPALMPHDVAPLTRAERIALRLCQGARA